MIPEFHHEDQQLCALLLESLNGNISFDQFQDLEQLLISKPEYMKLYLDLISIHTVLSQQGLSNFKSYQQTKVPGSEELLREYIDMDKELLDRQQKKIENIDRQKIEKAAQESLEEYLGQQKKSESDPARFVSREKKLATNLNKLPGFIRAMAACLIIAGCIWIYFQSGRVQNIANVTNQHNAQWQVEPFASLKNKEYILKSGMVDIQFYDGARITLEGPAEITFESANGAYLRQGKLTAHVPKRTVGFTIHTPSATYIDRSTDFSVEVQPNGASELHVHSGKVDIIILDKFFDNILTGQARSVSSDGYSIDEIEYRNETSFMSNVLTESTMEPDASSEDSDEPIVELNQSIPTSIDQSKYEKLIMAHQPICYYQFNSQIDHPDENYLVFENINLISDESLPMWDSSNKVLRLDYSTNNVLGLKCIQENKMTEGTIMLWFRIDHLPKHNRFLDVMSTYSIVKNQMSISEFTYPRDASSLEITSEISIDSYGTLELRYSREYIDDTVDNRVLNSQKSIQAQQWNYVALTYDRDKILTLYINGSKHDAMKITRQFHDNPWLFTFFGIYFDAGVVSPNVSFKGAVDDLAIFDHAMSAEQIEQLYNMAIMK